MRWAYPLGDFFSDIFGDTDSPFEGALGLYGPRPALGTPVRTQAIPKAEGYDHGDYVPGEALTPVQPAPKWARATRFWGQSIRGEPQPRW